MASCSANTSLWTDDSGRRACHTVGFYVSGKNRSISYCPALVCFYKYPKHAEPAVPGFMFGKYEFVDGRQWAKSVHTGTARARVCTQAHACTESLRT